jgi:hypothetical protein
VRSAARANPALCADQWTRRDPGERAACTRTSWRPGLKKKQRGVISPLTKIANDRSTCLKVSKMRNRIKLFLWQLDQEGSRGCGSRSRNLCTPITDIAPISPKAHPF